MSKALPALAGQWEPYDPPASHRGVGLTVINFNTAAQTLRCLESVETSEEAPAWILVLDNASAPENFELLAKGCRRLQRTWVRLYRSETNLGFAAGSNFLIEQLLADPSCRFVGLINNDAVAKPSMVSRLVDALVAEPARVGLAGGRMHRFDAPDEVDTLGITIYSSLMPADRKTTADPFLGPTGGCCMISRELISELKAVCGYCFDERFFCYCEDTDLVLRANLLGYRPAYVDEVVALHEGQASSGSGYNPFIAYHGIRNVLWMHLKLMPGSILGRHWGWLLLSHAGIVVRTLAAGHPRLLYSIYRDALARRRLFWAERRRFQPHVRVTPAQLAQRFAPRFYRQGYFRLVAAQLWAQYRGKPGHPR